MRCLLAFHALVSLTVLRGVRNKATLEDARADWMSKRQLKEKKEPQKEPQKPLQDKPKEKKRKIKTDKGKAEMDAFYDEDQEDNDSE